MFDFYILLFQFQWLHPLFKKMETTRLMFEHLGKNSTRIFNKLTTE